jgi:hypothetical protein
VPNNTHILKTWTHFYEDVRLGIKTFEIRKKRPIFPCRGCPEALMTDDFTGSNKTAVEPMAGGGRA